MCWRWAFVPGSLSNLANFVRQRWQRRKYPPLIRTHTVCWIFAILVLDSRANRGGTIYEYHTQGKGGWLCVLHTDGLTTSPRRRSGMEAACVQQTANTVRCNQSETIYNMAKRDALQSPCLSCVTLYRKPRRRLSEWEREKSVTEVQYRTTFLVWSVWAQCCRFKDNCFLFVRVRQN